MNLFRSDLGTFLLRLIVCVGVGALVTLFMCTDLWTRMRERLLG